MSAASMMSSSTSSNLSVLTDVTTPVTRLPTSNIRLMSNTSQGVSPVKLQYGAKAQPLATGSKLERSVVLG